MIEEDYKRLKPNLLPIYRSELRKIGFDIELTQGDSEKFWAILNGLNLPFAGWYGDEILFGNGDRYPAQDINDVVLSIKKVFESYGKTI